MYIQMWGLHSIINNTIHVLEQLTRSDYQLVQKEVIAEELSIGIKKKSNEMDLADMSETGAVNSDSKKTII